MKAFYHRLLCWLGVRPKGSLHYRQLMYKDGASVGVVSGWIGKNYDDQNRCVILINGVKSFDINGYTTKALKESK